MDFARVFYKFENVSIGLKKQTNNKQTILSANISVYCGIIFYRGCKRTTFLHKELVIKSIKDQQLERTKYKST